MLRLKRALTILGSRPLDSWSYRQRTPFSPEKISQVAYSPDGSPLIIERWHTGSDAVRFRDHSH